MNQTTAIQHIADRQQSDSTDYVPLSTILKKF
jgi:hypothetical protein